jgi:protein-arginine kinase activator protein McsA
LVLDFLNFSSIISRRGKIMSDKCPVFGMPCSEPKPFVASLIISGQPVTAECCQQCARMLKMHQTLGQSNNVCAGCGSTINDILKTKRIGCPLCYVWFKSLIDGIINKVQDGNIHIGKSVINSNAKGPIVDYLLKAIDERQAIEENDILEKVRQILLDFEKEPL